MNKTWVVIGASVMALAAALTAICFLYNYTMDKTSLDGICQLSEMQAVPDCGLLAYAADGALASSLWAFMSFLVAAATLCAVVFGFYQAQITQRIEYRAFLRAAVDRVHFNEQSCAVVKVVLKNYGRTPANDLKVIALAAVQYTDGKLSDTKSALVEIPTVHPGDDFVRIVTTDGGFSDVDGVNTGKIHLVVWIAIEYVDVFGRKHYEKRPTYFKNRSLEGGLEHLTVDQTR